MRRLTFRTQLTMNILTVLFVGLIVTTSTLARSGTGAILGQTSQTSTTTISYQGHLTNGSGQPLSATLPMIFALYTTPTGGTAVWTETRSAANAVPVANGLFSVLLGSVTPLDPNLLNQDLWLGISVDGDAEMTPREKLGSVPYAVRAGSVPDGSITPRKMKIPNYTVTLNTTVSTSSYTAQTIPGMSITIPARDVPTPTQALVLFQARCRPASGNTNEVALAVAPSVDGTIGSMIDAYPKGGQMLVYSFHQMYTLSPSIDHTLAATWRVALNGGAVECYDRTFTVILLSQ